MGHSKVIRLHTGPSLEDAQGLHSLGRHKMLMRGRSASCCLCTSLPLHHHHHHHHHHHPHQRNHQHHHRAPLLLRDSCQLLVVPAAPLSSLGTTLSLDFMLLLSQTYLSDVPSRHRPANRLGRLGFRDLDSGI